MDKIINNFVAYIWALLGIVTLIAMIVNRAWWHLPTVGICYVFFRAMYQKKGEE